MLLRPAPTLAKNFIAGIDVQGAQVSVARIEAGMMALVIDRKTHGAGWMKCEYLAPRAPCMVVVSLRRATVMSATPASGERAAVMLRIFPSEAAHFPVDVHGCTVDVVCEPPGAESNGYAFVVGASEPAMFGWIPSACLA